MRVFLALIIHLLCFSSLWGQVTIWSDNFNNGCSANCLANTHNGWTIQNNVGGVTGSAPNDWFVSCAEEGLAPPNCGSTCIGDASLHIGANAAAGGDMGASYNETGATNATYKRVISPTISTLGYSNITLEFHFIAYGSAACADDRAQLHLSTDDGSTWPAGFQYCLTSLCCGACNGYSQGQWTVYTLTLPAAFNDNPNVKIAFHWRNNGNGSGTDPSVAIDDIALTSSTPLPLSLLSFTARKEGAKVRLNWETTQETNLSHFELQRASEDFKFQSLAEIKAKGNDKTGNFLYTHLDASPAPNQSFYRLKMLDLNGMFSFSPIIEIKNSEESNWNISSLSTYHDILMCRLQSNHDFVAKIEIYSMEGKLVFSEKNKKIESGENFLSLNIASLSKDVYLFKITDIKSVSGKNSLTQKFVRD